MIPNVWSRSLKYDHSSKQCLSIYHCKNIIHIYYIHNIYINNYTYIIWTINLNICNFSSLLLLQPNPWPHPPEEFFCWRCHPFTIPPPKKGSKPMSFAKFWFWNIFGWKMTGWWLNQPISKLESSPNRGVNKKCFKPPPRWWWRPFHFRVRTSGSTSRWLVFRRNFNTLPKD